MALLYSPLDLKNILIVDLAGGLEIFSFLMVILFAFIAARFKFDNKISLSLFALFVVIMSSYLQGLFILVNIIGGLIVYYAVSKIT